jgi:hypothetical protein
MEPESNAGLGATRLISGGELEKIMPKFNVVINLTRTIEASVEMEITAKDEEAAQEKAEKKIQAAIEKAPEVELMNKFDWDITSEDDSFDYEVTEE